MLPGSLSSLNTGDELPYHLQQLIFCLVWGFFSPSVLYLNKAPVFE